MPELEGLRIIVLLLVQVLFKAYTEVCDTALPCVSGCDGGSEMGVKRGIP